MKTLMATFGAAFRAGDVDAAAACLADDFTWHLPSGTGDPCGQEIHGKEATREYLRQRFAEQANGGNGVRFSDSRMEIYGNTILLRYRVRGTAADCRTIDAAGLDVFRAENGKLVSKDAYWKDVVWPASGQQASRSIKLD